MGSFLTIVGLAALALGLIAGSVNKRRMTTPQERRTATWGVRIGVVLLALGFWLTSRSDQTAPPPSTPAVAAAKAQPAVPAAPAIAKPAYTIVESTPAPDGQGGGTKKIIVSGTITHAGLDALLRDLMDGVQGLTWAYTDEAHIPNAQWIGMIDTIDKTTPEVTIDDTKIAALTAAPVQKFGLSEPERQAIFREKVAAEDRADKDAEAQYPINGEYTHATLVAHGNLLDTKNEQYAAEIAKAHSLTPKQLESISVEGIQKNWAIPSSP